MRILIVGSAWSVHVQRWSQFLTERGHEVRIFSDRLADATNEPAVDVMRWPRLPKPVRYFVAALQLSRLIARFRPAVIHLQSIGANALLAPALPADRLVSTPWGNDVAGGLHHPIRRRLLGFALRRSALVLTTSRHMAATVNEAFGISVERIAVQSWGVDLRRFRPYSVERRDAERRRLGIPPGALVVSSIRSMTPAYRIAEVVRAFRAAAAYERSLYLVLISGLVPADTSGRKRQSEYRAAIWRELRSLQPDRWMWIDGTLSDDEYAALLAATDVAVSIPGADQRSSSALEAIASGATLVGSDIQPYREIAGDGFNLELLGEPIEQKLADWLRRPSVLNPTKRQSNRRLAEDTEAREHCFAAVEDHLLSVARAGTGSQQGQPR